jgi:hypothetical protein
VEPQTAETCNDSMRRVLTAALVLSTVACTRSEPAPSAASPGKGPSADATAQCPVTLPTGDHRHGDPAGLGRLGYGNGEVWVGLWPHGRVRATKDNLTGRGAIVMKFPWDRAVRGRLHITGRRIDAEAPPLRALLPDYGVTGFQASALIFPTEGCWEITGRIAQRTSLTFVTRVSLSL